MVRELADGTHVTLRPIGPDDREGLRRAFHEMSPQSRHSRFLGGVTELSDEMLTYLTDVDQRRHVAIVATTTSPDLKSERGVGVARFLFLDGAPGVVEAAITVVDDMQRKGLGTLLLRELERAARARNVHRIRAEVLAGNATMRGILHAVGAEPVPEDDRDPAELGSGRTVSYDIELEPLAVSARLLAILRGAAQTMSLTLRRILPPR